MPMTDAERCFVENCVTKRRRESVALELADPRRRSDCLLSFSEPHKERLMQERMTWLPDGASAEEALAQMCECGCKRCTEAYLMHLSAEFDQKVIPLKEALQKLWHAGPAVIICPEEKVALVMLESGKNDTIKAILRGC